MPVPSPLLDDTKFSSFLKDFRDEAIKAGIKGETYDLATAGITRNLRIAELNANQPEFYKPVWIYLETAVSADRITNGRAIMAGDSDILSPIAARYGVPAEILTAIWGNESDYGRDRSRYALIEALATLAYEGPRTDYARTQLIAALKMVEREGYAPAAMKSSWAGAFGQTQFVPTTFLKDAVDGDGDGKIDLWLDPADALASTANMLRGAGWAAGRPWGFEVSLPPGFPYEDADLDIIRPMTAWKKAGVKTAAGNDLPSTNEPASIYLPAGARGPAFLVQSNFKTLLRYNNAASYALAVCLLADQIKPDAQGPVLAAWPRDLRPLTRSERIALQDGLAKLGFDIGKSDAMIGGKSRAAMRVFQKAHGLAADGYATPDLLSRILSEARLPVAGQ